MSGRVEEDSRVAFEATDHRQVEGMMDDCFAPALEVPLEFGYTVCDLGVREARTANLTSSPGPLDESNLLLPGIKAFSLCHCNSLRYSVSQKANIL